VYWRRTQGVETKKIACPINPFVVMTGKKKPAGAGFFAYVPTRSGPFLVGLFNLGLRKKRAPRRDDGQFRFLGFLRFLVTA
jgi:hypothetical protein